MRKGSDIFLYLNYVRTSYCYSKYPSKFHCDIGFRLIGLKYNDKTMDISDSKSLILSKEFNKDSRGDAFLSRYFNDKFALAFDVFKNKRGTLEVSKEGNYRERFSILTSKILLEYLYNECNRVVSGLNISPQNCETVDKPLFSVLIPVLKE